MSEIYDLDLSNCDLAILSACDTNYGPQQTGEGVWALSRGFLVAGARRVVASNWLVDDEAGATLVHHFTAVLAKSGEDRPRATMPPRCRPPNARSTSKRNGPPVLLEQPGAGRGEMKHSERQAGVLSPWSMNQTTARSHKRM